MKFRVRVEGFVSDRFILHADCADDAAQIACNLVKCELERDTFPFRCDGVDVLTIEAWNESQKKYAVVEL